MKKPALAAVSALALAALTAPAAAAPNIGDTITCASGILICVPTTASVTAAPEFVLTLGPSLFLLAADFSQNQVTVTNVLDGPFGVASGDNNFVSFSDLTSEFTDAALVASSGVNFFDQSNISLNNGALRIVFGQGNRSTQFEPGASFTIRLGTETAAVPEPAIWGLMLAGFGLVGAGARSRRRSAAVTYA